MTEKAGSPPSYDDLQSGFPTGQGAGGYPPQGAGVFPLQGAGGYPPQEAGGYLPQGAGGYPPQVAGGYPPQGAGGYPPRGAGGYPPQEAGGYPPQGAKGYPPQGAGGYLPHGAGGYLPQGAGGYPQGAAGEYPPKPQPGTYGQPGNMQPGYGQTYVQQTAQAVIFHQPGVAGHVILQPRPPNYMVASIFVCLCCFWPTGLCAIYYALQANRLAAEGDMAEATIMSNRARNLMIASIVIGIIWITLVIVLRVGVYASYYSYNYQQ